MDFVGRFQQPVEGGFLVEIPHLFIRVFYTCQVVGLGFLGFFC